MDLVYGGTSPAREGDTQKNYRTLRTYLNQLPLAHNDVAPVDLQSPTAPD